VIPVDSPQVTTTPDVPPVAQPASDTATAIDVPAVVAVVTPITAS